MADVFDQVAQGQPRLKNQMPPSMAGGGSDVFDQVAKEGPYRNSPQQQAQAPQSLLGRVGSWVDSHLPQGEAPPPRPTNTIQEFMQLPPEQREAYQKQFSDWNARQAMGIVSGFAGGEGAAAADVPWGRVAKAGWEGAKELPYHLPVIGRPLRMAMRAWRAAGPAAAEEATTAVAADAAAAHVPPAEAPPAAQRPVNVRGPGEIAPEMIRPRAFPARTPEPIPPRPGLSLPPGPAAPPPTSTAGSLVESVRGWTPPDEFIGKFQPQKFGGFGDVQEDAGIEQEIAGRVENEGRRISADESRRAWAANSPAIPKNVLIEQMGGKVPEKPVNLKPYPRTPAKDEDMTSLLNKSVEWAKKKRGR